MVILRNLEVFQGFRDAFLSSTAFIKNIDSPAFPSFPSPSHPWVESVISVPEISHHVPLHQQPWQQCQRSKVGLFAAFWALLPNTESLHRNNEELQCTGQLPGKLKNSVSTGLTQAKTPSCIFFLIFECWGSRSGPGSWSAEWESVVFTHQCSEPNCVFKCGCQSFRCRVKSSPTVVLAHPHRLSVLRSGVSFPPAPWQVGRAFVCEGLTHLPRKQWAEVLGQEQKARTKVWDYRWTNICSPLLLPVVVLIFFDRHCQTM